MIQIKRSYKFLLASFLTTVLVWGSFYFHPPATANDDTSDSPIAQESWTEFILPPLPYDYDALSEYIDAQTMTLHHDKHHAGYVKNLNHTTWKVRRKMGN